MRKSILVAVLALPVAATAASSQQVSMTANVGWVSEYIFRGIPQNSSSASAGVDVTMGALTLGTWGADVGDGNEVDVYGKVGFGTGNFRFAVGGTGYFYTGDFDHTYLEGNLEAGYGPLTAAFALGTHDAEPSANYWFLGITGKVAGFSLSAGHFDYDNNDARSGNYGRAGYDVAIKDFLDVSVAWIVSDEVLSGMGRVDHTLVLGLGKTFTVR
jgi:hypothetical protein